MSGLFIELYLDEDVDVLVADLVRARGFDVVTRRPGRREKLTTSSWRLLPASNGHY